MKATFTTMVTKDDKVNATGLPVPAEAVAAMGAGKKPKVLVSLNGYTYRSTVAAYGEISMLPLAAEHRQAAGVQAGDQVEVTIQLDTEPRTVEVPAELADALAAYVGARAAFDSLSYTMRKEYARQVESAKSPDTRQRRIEKILAALALR